MHSPGIKPRTPAWQERILVLNWHQCPIKNWLVALNKRGIVVEFLWWKEKRKTKQNKKTQKQKNKKGKVEKGVQIIRE